MAPGDRDAARARVVGTGAKLGYVVGVRGVESLLRNPLLRVAATPLYGVYVRAPDVLAVSPSTDQSLAGAVMLVDGTLVTVPLLVWLFLRLQAEAEARQSLIERGIDPRRARRAVRYGRWHRPAQPLTTTSRSGARPEGCSRL